MIERGDWVVADIARNSFDLEGKVVGTLGCGRIGYRVLQRLKPFDCKELLYFDYAQLPAGEFCFIARITFLALYTHMNFRGGEGRGLSSSRKP